MSFEKKHSELRAKTISGIKWASIGQLLVNVFDFAVYIVLARVLFPEDFGVFAMATVFTGFIAIINQLGLEIAIVQRKTIEEIHLSTAFWCILAFGSFLCLAVIGAAFLFSHYFTNPLVRPILIILSLNFILADLGFIQQALLQRWFAFKKIAFIESSTILLGGGASILMALHGWGVWSLVGGWVGQGIVRVTLLWVLCSWRPKMIFDFNSFKELFSFSKFIVGTKICMQLCNNIVYFLIGRNLGEAALGIYAFAFKLSHIPATKLSPIVVSVALPAFSSIQEDLHTMRKIYQKKMKYLALLCTPLLLGMAILAPRFIEIVYGSKWVAAVIPLQILCWMGLARAIGGFAGAIIRAKGQPKLEFFWSLFVLTSYPLTLFFVIESDLTTICLALTIITILTYIVYQQIANSLIKLRWHDFITNFYPALLSSFLMVATLLLYNKVFGLIFSTTSIVGILLPICLGILVFIGSIRLFFTDFYNETMITLGYRNTTIMPSNKNRIG